LAINFLSPIPLLTGCDRLCKTTRDYNPVHFDERFANVKHFKGRICHGLLIGSLITEIGGQLGWLATEMNFKFKKPVYFGDTITCELTINDIDANGFAEADAVFTKLDGIVVLEAVVKGNLPSEPEREVMNMMIEEGDPTNMIGKQKKVRSESPNNSIHLMVIPLLLGIIWRNMIFIY